MHESLSLSITISQISFHSSSSYSFFKYSISTDSTSKKNYIKFKSFSLNSEKIWKIGLKLFKSIDCIMIVPLIVSSIREQKKRNPFVDGIYTFYSLFSLHVYLSSDLFYFKCSQNKYHTKFRTHIVSTLTHQLLLRFIDHQ